MIALPTPSRCAAIAGRQLRRIARGRLVAWTLLVAALEWYAAADLRGELRGTLVLVLLPSLLAVVVTGAGVLADDLESGAHMLDVAHGAAPSEIALGATVAVAVASLPAFFLLAAATLATPAARAALPVAIVMLTWILIAILAWSALAVAVATLVAGKGNAAVLAPLLLFGGFPADELPLEPLPQLLELPLRALWSALPLQAHVAAIRDALLLGAPLDPLPVLVLLLAPVGALLLASWRLARIEPAARWRR